jgi:SAM-dependent methyltransferase
MSTIEHINNILFLHHHQKVQMYKFPQDITMENKIYILSCLIDKCDNFPLEMIIDNKQIKHNNYKREYYIPLIEFVINQVISIYSSKPKYRSEIEDIITNKLLKILTSSYKGQYLLNRINFIISKIIKQIDSEKLLLLASSKGTLITFLFWLEYYGVKNIEDLPNNIQETIFVNSIGNSDDRLYKYMIKKIISVNKLFFQQNSSIINNILNNLACSDVPPKYILRRLKYLSEQVSLVSYFHLMIELFSNKKIISNLHKYYYFVPHTFNTIIELCKGYDYYDNLLEKCSISSTDIDNIMTMLKTNIEKHIFCIVLSSLYHIKYDIFKMNENIFEKIVKENYEVLISRINWEMFLSNLDLFPINKKIIRIFTDNNLITKFCIDKGIITRDILLFTRFFVPTTCRSGYIPTFDKTFIMHNKALHYLRMAVKRRFKKKIINYKVKMFDIFKELTTFEPNKNIPVLSHGSEFYRIQKQRFSNLPPRHLLPNQIKQYDEFILREKADGILINNLPIDIFPKNQIINNHIVNAEYIEELDLYLVFDIDIPNMDIVDRYNMIRTAHPYTRNTKLTTINSMTEFIKVFENERKNINKFLTENSNEIIKWYPKFSCLVKEANIQFKQDILNIINTSQFSNILCNSEPYKCDGLILSPLNGDREIKIKPKELITIDLLYSSKKWIDRNKNNWTHIIENNKEVKVNKIYRCYPVISNSEIKFKVGEYRYDKKYPNPYNVVNNILCLIKYDYNDFSSNQNNQEKDYYYQKIGKNISGNFLLTQIFNKQRELLDNNIKLVDIEMNGNWLDLGCGKGKLIPIIQKYNPSYYLGLDIDDNQLFRAIKYSDEKQQVYNFSPCNLAEEWNDTSNKWLSIDNKIKFNYVVSNFSIHYFFTDKFWEQLSNIVMPNTKFIFNLVNENAKNKEWYYDSINGNKSYMKINGNKVSYLFDWIHQSEKIEGLICREHIFRTLKKFGWRLVNELCINETNQNTPIINNLVNMYSWFIIEKI